LTGKYYNNIPHKALIWLQFWPSFGLWHCWNNCNRSFPARVQSVEPDAWGKVQDVPRWRWRRNGYQFVTQSQPPE